MSILHVSDCQYAVYLVLLFKDCVAGCTLCLHYVLLVLRDAHTNTMFRVFSRIGANRHADMQQSSSAWQLPDPFDAPTGHQQLRLRPMQLADWEEYSELCTRNAAWLAPWKSGNPIDMPSIDVEQWIAIQQRELREGQGVQLLMEHGGQIVGNISLGAVVYGSVRSAMIGYWVDQAWAGHGFAPLAVAMLTQWALCDSLGPKLHRIEIAIIPTNQRSHEVVRKLGFTYEGTMRKYMYVNNAWRDHDIYSCLAEDILPTAMGGAQGGKRNILADRLLQ